MRKHIHKRSDFTSFGTRKIRTNHYYRNQKEGNNKDSSRNNEIEN